VHRGYVALGFAVVALALSGAYLVGSKMPPSCETLVDEHDPAVQFVVTARDQGCHYDLTVGELMAFDVPKSEVRCGVYGGAKGCTSVDRALRVAPTWLGQVIEARQGDVPPTPDQVRYVYHAGGPGTVYLLRYQVTIDVHR